jgi:hypothetical protein
MRKVKLYSGGVLVRVVGRGVCEQARGLLIRDCALVCLFLMHCCVMQAIMSLVNGTA